MLVQDFLEKKHVVQVDHPKPPKSLDLSPCELYPLLKKKLKDVVMIRQVRLVMPFFNTYKNVPRYNYFSVFKEWIYMYKMHIHENRMR